MTVIKRVVALAILSLAVAPFSVAAAAHGNSPSKTSKTCSEGEVYYDVKDCCLPEGGPSTSSAHSSATPTTAVHTTAHATTTGHSTVITKGPTTTTSAHTSATAVSGTPPSGKSCPPTNWWWHDQLECCVPNHPVQPNSPPPQCSKYNEWEDAIQCCIPSSPSKSTSTSKPSATPKSGHKKRHLTSRAVTSCPNNLDACPISGLLSGDYECLDTSVELESCGGCTSLGQGQDCTAIKGAWNVGCHNGRCKVYSCFGGFRLSADGASCVSY